MSLHEALVEAMRRVYDRSTKDEDQAAVPSGLQALDELTCGFHPGELVVLATRPSLGKRTRISHLGQFVSIVQ